MPKVDYSSDQLPVHLSDKARFMLWRDIWLEQLGAAEIKHADDKPFATSSRNVMLGNLGVSRFRTTTNHYVRTRKHVANDRDDIYIGFYRSPKPQIWSAGNRDLTMKNGSVMAYNIAQPCSSFTDGVTSWVMASIPRAQILKVVPHADDRAVTTLDRSDPIVRHLEHTIDFLLNADEVHESPPLMQHAETMLADLIALALGARGEEAHVAQTRGLRAARLRELLSIIEARFADPSLSPAAIADSLGLSDRYVRDLLFESGKTFSERVLELRLHKARVMLSDVRSDTLKISEIAMACGFNEVTYFNRRFRARFGCSPTQYRGRL
jgi:AraC-like DNA-binding protein